MPILQTATYEAFPIAHPMLKDHAKVKSVDIHPVTQQIVLSTWSATLRLFLPEGTITFKNARPYKARWLP